MRPHVSPNGSNGYSTIFQNAMSSCIEVYENDSDLQLIRKKLEHLRPKIFQKCCEAVQRNDSELNVLTHGDLWSNNIMFDLNGDPDRLLFVRVVNFRIPSQHCNAWSVSAGLSIVLLGVTDSGCCIFAIHHRVRRHWGTWLGCPDWVLFQWIDFGVAAARMQWSVS